MALFKKSKTQKPIIDASALDQRIRDLRTLDQELLAEQLLLEGAGAKPLDEADLPKVERRALQLLAGDGAAQIPLPPHHGVRLSAVIEERAAIERALILATDRLFRARCDEMHAAKLARDAAWRELQRERALTILKLQRLNRAAEAHAFEVGGKLGRYVGLVTQVGPAALLGQGAGRDPADQFVTDVLRSGIITEGEIAKERDAK